MASKKTLAISVIILIIVLITVYYMYGDRSQFFALYFLAAGADCELECVNEFKSWCIVCQDDGWPEDVVLSLSLSECIDSCVPKNIQFPDQRNCANMNGVCIQMFPIKNRA